VGNLDELEASWISLSHSFRGAGAGDVEREREKKSEITRFSKENNPRFFVGKRFCEKSQRRPDFEMLSVHALKYDIRTKVYG